MLRCRPSDVQRAVLADCKQRILKHGVSAVCQQVGRTAHYADQPDEVEHVVVGEIGQVLAAQVEEHRVFASRTIGNPRAMRRAIILPRQEAVEIHVVIQEVGTHQMELSSASDSRRGGLVALVAAKSVTKLLPALVLQDNRQLCAV